MSTYRLYIDETGDHTYGRKEIKQFRIKHKEKIIIEFPTDDYPELNKEDKRYLAFLGCIVEKEYYNRVFKPELEKIKIDIFPSHSEEKPVIFHRKEIINKKGAIDYILGIFKNVSERKVCKAIEQPRSTQRYQLIIQDSDTRLTSRITELACQYGRYGYRRITALLKSEGWQVNQKINQDRKKHHKNSQENEQTLT